jgi:orotate phosphoribosyltransferase
MVQFWHRNQTQIFVNLAIFFMTAVITKTFNFILLAQLLVLSYIFGLLLGAVGAAAQIAVILLLKNLKGISLTT